MGGLVIGVSEGQLRSIRGKAEARWKHRWEHRRQSLVVLGSLLHARDPVSDSFPFTILDLWFFVQI